MRALPVVASLAASLALAACAQGPSPAQPAQDARAKRPSIVAVAAVEPTKGNQARGTVRFMQEDDAVVVVASLSGFAPGSEHGFHMHEKGDCSAPDAASAGGHFNPDGSPHGPQSGPHHAGDMPAIKADANGVVDASFVLHGVTVSAGPHSIVGKALIVHKDADDYTTQPTGNSGARAGCGVIRLR